MTPTIMGKKGRRCVHEKNSPRSFLSTGVSRLFMLSFGEMITQCLSTRDSTETKDVISGNWIRCQVSITSRLSVSPLTANGVQVSSYVEIGGRGQGF